MSSYREITLAEMETQAFSLMGRMHFILRRQTGRITDIEYMRNDPSYCRHLLDMALGVPNDDLKQVCERLQAIYFGQDGLFTRKPSAEILPRQTNSTDLSEIAHSPRIKIEELTIAAEVHHRDEAAKAYIGRLR